MCRRFCDHQLVDASELCDFGGQCLQIKEDGTPCDHPEECVFYDPITI